jgi:hypothetical protein
MRFPRRWAVSWRESQISYQTAPAQRSKHPAIFFFSRHGFGHNETPYLVNGGLE